MHARFVKSSPNLLSRAVLLPFCRSFRALDSRRNPLRLVGVSAPCAGTLVRAAGVELRRRGVLSCKESMGMAGDEAAPAKRFWNKFRKEADFGMFSPFVVCLASGTLELDVFRHYVAEDVHFLKAFVRAFEMAEECSDDDEAKVVIKKLRKGLVDELKMRDYIVHEWGVGPVKDRAPNPATAKYTAFLLSTASGKVDGGKGANKIATPFEKTILAAYAVGAMTPCMSLYAFLGKELSGIVNSENSHPYKKWIDTYASKHFQAPAKQTEDLLDQLSVSLTGEEVVVIEKLYQKAMKLESELFHAQPITQKAVVPFSRIHDPSQHRFFMFSDFDLTCSIIDSSAILAEIAILSAKKAEQSRPGNSGAWESGELRNSWDALSKQYTEEYEKCVDNITQRAEALSTYEYEKLHNALEQLSDFEQRGNLRVVDSGVLKGMNFEDIRRAGESLILHDGCKNFFQQIVNIKDKLNAEVHILSYCWCDDLIKSVFSSGGLEVVNIHSNELVFDQSRSTGHIVRRMESPLNKVHVLKDIIKKSIGDARQFSVYVGDSVGDLLCLLEADIGIVIGSSVSLRKVGSHFGVSFVPLFPGIVKRQREFVRDNSSDWVPRKGTLFTASNWNEIHAFILGL